MDDLPDKLTVTAGEEALVRLPSLAAAGYKWQATADRSADCGGVDSVRGRSGDRRWIALRRSALMSCLF